MIGFAGEPTARQRGAHSLVSVVRRARGDLRVRRRLLGHLVASLDRPRHVLVGAAHGDLRLRHPRGHLLRLPDFHDDVRAEPGAERRQRPHLGIVGSVGRVHLGLGRRRHAGVGAVRRLVAQRLRARRADHQPAAHGAGRGVLRHRARHGHADARVHEPRARAAAAGARAPVSCMSAARCCASRC